MCNKIYEQIINYVMNFLVRGIFHAHVLKNRLQYVHVLKKGCRGTVAKTDTLRIFDDFELFKAG